MHSEELLHLRACGFVKEFILIQIFIVPAPDFAKNQAICTTSPMGDRESIPPGLQQLADIAHPWDLSIKRHEDLKRSVPRYCRALIFEAKIHFIEEERHGQQHFSSTNHQSWRSISTEASGLAASLSLSTRSLAFPSLSRVVVFVGNACGVSSYQTTRPSDHHAQTQK